MASGLPSPTAPPVAGADPHELGDSPWPVYARKVLTRREETLHRNLLAAFPDSHVHAQVALSQLIDVPEDHPDRASVRNRFSQLVADFVLYRQDLSVIAVIELDDRSHERTDRQYADARKTKALRDAGLRLIRIPAGTLPTAEQLLDLIGDIGAPPSPEKIKILQGRQEPAPAIAFGRIDEPAVERFSNRLPRLHSEPRRDELLRELVRPILSVAGVFLVGWLGYRQMLHLIAAPPTRPTSMPALPRAVSPAIPSAGSQPEEAAAIAKRVADERRAVAEAALVRQHAEAAKARLKEQAWQKVYIAPAWCEHPPSWRDQVECGNEYMRAKKQFEATWKDE